MCVGTLNQVTIDGPNALIKLVWPASRQRRIRRTRPGLNHWRSGMYAPSSHTPYYIYIGVGRLSKPMV